MRGEEVAKGIDARHEPDRTETNRPGSAYAGDREWCSIVTIDREAAPLAVKPTAARDPAQLDAALPAHHEQEHARSASHRAGRYIDRRPEIRTRFEGESKPTLHDGRIDREPARW